MTIQDHTKLITPMLITKLGQHPIILEKLWMKKHGVILDMRNDRLTFWPEYCQHVITKPCAEKPRAAEPHAEKSHTEVPHADVPRKIILKQLLTT